MKHLILATPFVLAACGSVESTPQVEAFIASDPVAAIEAVKEAYEELPISTETLDKAE